jgi:hypothetical protein
VTGSQRFLAPLFDSSSGMRKALSQIAYGEEHMQAVDEAVGLFFGWRSLLASCGADRGSSRFARDRLHPNQV